MEMTILLLSILAATFCFLPGSCRSCDEGAIRLAGDFRNESGPVELCHTGEWYKVCNNSNLRRVSVAQVLCRQLGYHTDDTTVTTGFGSGRGVLLNVECNGLESRLDQCINSNGTMSFCTHVGINCYSEVERCGYEQYQPSVSREEAERFGNCVPFKIIGEGSPCDPLYTPGVDYIYVSNRRTNGDYDRYIEIVDDSRLILNIIPEECVDVAYKVLCHFFLPPCGNSTHFEPPTSVCSESCNYLRSVCPDAWDRVVAHFRDNDYWLRPLGVTYINCSHSGEFIYPLPHCCSDVGVEIPCAELDGSGNLFLEPKCLSPSPTASIISTTDSLVPSPHDSQVTTVTVASVCAVLFLLLLAGAAALLCIVNRRRQKKKIISITEPQSPLNLLENRHQHRIHYYGDLLQPVETEPRRARVNSGYIRQMTEEKLLIPGKYIQLQDCVGQGEFGIVYRGSLSGWRAKEMELIAVKTLKGVFSSNDLNNMIEESQKMSKFNNSHVMKLVGVCIDKGESPLIVMPFMIYGSLLSYLRKHRAELTIASDDNIELIEKAQSILLSMCLQISKGMAYLAQERFVHRDLAARNCMIDSNFVIKVSDFGLSEDIYSRNYFKQGQLGKDSEDHVKLPVRWMALESLNDGLFTEKTDVWSFGVTCWEVFSLGKSPYPGVDPFALIKFLQRGERLDKPLNTACSQDIYDMIMRECWQELPDKRPFFSDLVTTISTSLERIAGYLDFTAVPLTPSAVLSGSGYDRLQITDAVQQSRRQEAGYDHLIEESTHFDKKSQRQENDYDIQ